MKRDRRSKRYWPKNWAQVSTQTLDGQLRIEKQEVVWVTRNDNAVLAAGAKGHLSIDNVTRSLRTTEQAHRLRQRTIQRGHGRLPVTDQGAKSGLPGAPPDLCKGACWNDDSRARDPRQLEELAKEGVVFFERDEGPRVEH
jgi:hypothetical protein